MKKEQKLTKNIIISVVIIALLIWFFWPIDDEYSESQKPIKEDNFSNIQELHWTHMPLSYKFVNIGNCNEIQINHMKKGLEIVENSTDGLVSFVESEGEIDLRIECINRKELVKEEEICKNVSFADKPERISWYDDGFLDRSKERFISAKILSTTEEETIYELCYIDLEELGINFDSEILGEGGPSEMYENLIIKGELRLYQEGEGFTTCTFPSKEIHELLHSFGIDHSYEPEWVNDYVGWSDWNYARDIMFPYNYCGYQKELNEKYISCLKKIYSNGNYEGSCEGVNFLEFEYECLEGTYPVENSDYCCPEPGMEIIGGYCY